MTYLKSHRKLTSQAGLHSGFLTTSLVCLFPHYGTFHLPYQPPLQIPCSSSDIYQQGHKEMYVPTGDFAM